MNTKNIRSLSRHQKQLFDRENTGLQPFSQIMFYVAGNLDELLFSDVFARLIKTHASLRTRYRTFRDEDYPSQEIMDHSEPFCHFSICEGDRQLATEKLLQARKIVNRNLTFIADVVQSEQEACIILTLSAFSGDSYSLDLLKDQLLKGLTGAGNIMEEDISYFQFSQWQDELLQELTVEEIAYWDQYKIEEDRHFRFHIPADNILPHPECHSFLLPANRGKDIQRSFPAREEVFWTTCWLGLLSRHNDGLPVTIGYGTGTRPYPEITGLVGLVNRTLPLTAALDDRLDFLEHTRQVLKEIEDIQTNQHAWSSTTSFSVSFEYIRCRQTTEGTSEVALLISHQEYHPIKLVVIDNGHTVLLQIFYDPACYMPAAVEEIGRQLIALTEQALLHLTTPWGDIPMADPSDPALNELGAGPAISLEYDNINQALDRIALKDPLKPAVTINERELSYATLRSLSDKLAGTLLGDHKIMTGDRVGVVMQRSELSICILAGILKSAAVYVPIDPGEEIARIKYMIEDSGCKMVICDEQLVYLLAWAPVPVLAATDLMKEEHRTIPFPQCEPHFEAYVLYTPGTITLPKGIPVSHGSLIAHSTWSLDTFDIRPSDGFASMSSFELDPGSADVWTSLLTGGTIHILPEYLSRTPEVLVKYLRNKQVSILKFTPSFFSVLLKEAAPELAKLLPGIRLLFLEGERIRPADLSLVWTMDDNIRIIQWRSIGIPPVTILAHELEKDRITYYQRHAVAGRPTGNESIFVLDPRQRPCPPGIIGEIYVAISHHPERAGLLKTGDKGYWNLYHELELAGNEDRLDAFQEDGMEGLADDLPAGVRAEMMEMVRTIWEEVFRRKNIGGHDNFFHLGGDSIKALQISSRLHAKGYLIHAMEIFNHPSIAALASAIKPNARHTGMASFEGAFPMTPVYQYFFEHTKIAPHHYNQSMLLSVANTEMEELDEIIGKIFENHDILRLTMQRNEEDWAAFVQPVGFRAALACTAIDADQDGLQHLQDIAAPLQTGFDLLTGPLAHFHLFTTKRGNYLFIVLHHLVTDVVSWNILVDDINELLDLRQKGLPLLLPFRAGSYGLWASRLAEYALSPRIQGQFDHWSATPSGMTLPIDNPQGSNRFRYISTCSFMLDKEDTAKLIDSNNVNGQQGIQACILTALGMGLQTVTGLSEVLVMMESHGRQVIGEDLNIDRTMGWFTALYPLYFSFKTPEIAANRELLSGLLKEIPDNGIGYGLLRYLDHTKKDRLQHRPPIIFNYLGNNQGGGRNRLVKIVDRQFGTPESEDEYRTFEWDVISYIANGEFRLNLSYSSERFDKEKMLALATSIRNALLEIVNQKTKPAALAYDELTREDIESFFD